MKEKDYSRFNLQYQIRMNKLQGYGPKCQSLLSKLSELESK